MPERLTPDLCVIGAGSGGLSVTAAAAAFGVPVVLIEKSDMGGDCLNTGCVPSKALLAAAKHVADARGGAAFGVDAIPQVDFARVRAHVHATIAAIAPTDSAERFTALGVQVIRGTARFVDKRTVAVDDYEIRARRFVIATGSRAAVPPIPGLDGIPFLTNESIFDLTECPRHLIVVGAGPIGLELAQAFRRLGSQVTVLEAAQPLAKDDPEAAAIVVAQLESEGIVIRTGVRIVRVSGSTGQVDVTIAVGDREEALAGSHLLIAAGRAVDLAALNLDAAGIRHNHKGVIANAKLRTSNRRVYVAGDAAGGAQFTHAANYHAGVVIRNVLFRLPAKADPDAVPWVTFTEPELAQTGLTEAEARRRGYAVRVARWPYHDNDRAHTERTVHGHIKIVTSKKGRILGATIVGAQAGELISTWTLAIAQRLNIRALTSVVVPYPTLSEVGKRAAIDFCTPNLTRPWVRRIIALLRKFG
jgi:pyruvate/2-oxoglutarate dehydrogenase complex dihydrolipoamide dehydrogenase (E3) component